MVHHKGCEYLTTDQNTNKVDGNTLEGKLMMGYQGWFGCNGDGSEANWWHWSLDNSIPNSSNLSTDMWPDVTELGSSEVFPTGMTYLNLTQASLYSAYIGSVVDRHFAWMEAYGLDGVMLQRFVCDLHDQRFKDFRDKVASNVKAAAQAHGRVFCIMYDITGCNGTSLVEDIEKDWQHLVSDDLKITDSTSYLKHKGKNGLKPLLAIWGLGFTDRPGTASQANQLITDLKTGVTVGYQVALLGGVPTNWRTPGTSGGDSKPNEDPGAKPGDPTWLDVYKSFDVLSPWSVNRYSYDRSPTKMGANDFLNNLIVPDLRELLGSEVEYMPVVFPGYSTKNQGRKDPDRTLNEVPRLGGRFWWRQVYNAVEIAKCNMIYGAMFDEVNEGTAMFKLIADQKGLPQQAASELVPLNVPGESPGNLKSDYYLWLAGETNKRLRNGTKFTSNMPTRPQPSLFRRALSLVRRRS
jgi:hypothetical protein